jgi:hypothetical protein
MTAHTIARASVGHPHWGHQKETPSTIIQAMLTTSQEATQAIMKAMSAEELAHSLRARGIKTSKHNDYHWKQTAPGFYEPLHWMARLSSHQATRPSPLSWGFRASINDHDQNHANGAIPLYTLPSLKNYEEKNLSSNRRNRLRRCRKQVQIAQITDAGILRNHGYAILASATKRTGHASLVSEQSYIAEINLLEDELSRQSRFVLGGWIDGKLGGYITGFACDGIAYLDETVIATEAMPSCIGIGLLFEFIQACRRSEDVLILVNGLHSREDSELHSFKQSFGFQVERIPAIIQMNSIARKIIRKRFPDKYYRLTGVE